eukprot:snap_masked-scaffold1443_size41101-processed-gene-0.5 protein:Tk06078 transcript:snap_masked-scaffold1443_size41101-processed-gene-0.5-mRNA-1 annotation:"low quality protein: protein fam69b"
MSTKPNDPDRNTYRAQLDHQHHGSDETQDRGDHSRHQFVKQMDFARMCDKYRQGLILGDLCPDFCTDPSQIEVDSCQTQHFGKEVVFSALWKHSNPPVEVRKPTEVSRRPTLEALTEVSTEAHGSVG